MCCLELIFYIGAFFAVALVLQLIGGIIMIELEDEISDLKKNWKYIFQFILFIGTIVIIADALRAN